MKTEYRWNLKPLGEIFDTTSGGTPSRSRKDFYVGNIVWVKSGELNDNQFLDDSEEHITQEAIENSSAKLFSADTVLIAMYGATTGKLGILRKSAATNQAVCAILPNNNFMPKTVFYYLLWKRQSLINQGQGGAQPNINQGIIKQLEFPEIPYQEQEQICDAIETQFTRLDAAIKSLKTIKQKLEVYRKSILSVAFRTGLSTNCKFTVFTLNDLKSDEKYSIKRGPFGGSLKKEIFVPTGYKVYEQKNAIKNDFFIGKYFIGEEKFQEMKVFSVKPGDFIISCSGTIGRIARVPGGAREGIINQALLKIKVRETLIIPKYFEYLFRSDIVQRRLTKISRGVAIKNVPSVKDLKNMELPIPKINEQERIVDEIESRFSVLAKIEEVVNNALLKADRLRKSILKAAFEGKLAK